MACFTRGDPVAKAGGDPVRPLETGLDRFLALEAACVGRSLADLFGYHLVWIGDGEWAAETVCSSPIRHRLWLAPSQPERAGLWDGTRVRGRTEALPLAADSVDVVVLWHALERSSDPHAVLREVERILRPEGVVVLVAINPWRRHGLRALLQALRRRRLRPPRPIGAGRVADWLGVLGFDVLSVEGVSGRGLSAGVRRVLGEERAAFGPLLGAGFVCVARKRVSTLTSWGRTWRVRPAVIAGGLAEPTARFEGRRVAA